MRVILLSSFFAFETFKVNNSSWLKKYGSLRFVSKILTIYWLRKNRIIITFTKTYYYERHYAQIINHNTACNESIIAFLESSDFESVIRLTVSLGGDADTMGAITGGIAEAFYGGVPNHIKKEVLKRLPNEFIDVMQRFYHKFVEK